MHDPGIGFVTLTRVHLSADLQSARVLQVGRHLDAGDGDEPDPRVVHLAGEHRRQLVANLIGDAIGTGALRH